MSLRGSQHGLSDGAWVLNSEISHICARRERGPRWNKSQSAEENRSAANLILMCHQHAAEIDDKHGRVKYSAETLLEWKQAQLHLHRKMSIGWPLTTKMAQDALAASFTHSGIVINNSNLQLGGEGGKAPGAGGKVKRTIKAGGGKGAEAGRLPDDWVPVSNVDLVGGFGVITLMLANAVDVRDGLLFVLGGGWARYLVPSVPLDTIWTLVCGASWKTLAQGPTRGLQVCLRDPSGKEVSRIAIGVSPELQKESNVHWVVNIGAQLDAPGSWILSVRSGNFLLAEHRFS